MVEYQEAKLIANKVKFVYLNLLKKMKMKWHSMIEASLSHKNVWSSLPWQPIEKRFLSPIFKEASAQILTSLSLSLSVCQNKIILLLLLPKRRRIHANNIHPHKWKKKLLFTLTDFFFCYCRTISFRNFSFSIHLINLDWNIIIKKK